MTAPVQTASNAAFAKLFDTPHGQLLVSRDFDGDDGDELVTIRGKGLPGIRAETQYRYDHAAQADLAFSAFDQTDANHIAMSMATLLAEVAA